MASSKQLFHLCGYLARHLETVRDAKNSLLEGAFPYLVQESVPLTHPLVLAVVLTLPPHSHCDNEVLSAKFSKWPGNSVSLETLF